VHGGPKNHLVVYVTSGSTYIDTLGIYATSGNQYLTQSVSWRAAHGSSTIAADIKMGATRVNFTSPAPNFSWDLKNRSGVDVPNGTYTIHIENVGENNNRRYTSFTFVKDSNTRTQSVSSAATEISSVKYIYLAPVTVTTATVSFDAQGGITPIPMTTTVTNGLTYGTLATTTRPGYIFGGWWTGTGGTGTEVTSGTTVTITAAQILYAKWIALQVLTVTFDGQGGITPIPMTTTVTNGLTYGTLATTTRAGYTFAGWWTAVNGGGTQVTSSTTVTITAAQTLYAKWTVNAISTVTFDAQGGTAASPSTTTVTNGLTYGTLATTTRAGYTFAGWWTGAGGTGTQVASDTTVTITAAQTLYAKWTVNAVSTVSFDAQGGTTPVPATTVVTNGLTYGTLATTARAGFTFGGWWTGAGGTGTQVTSGTTVTITAAQTLYAKWTLNAVSTVSFDAQGGTAASPSTTTVTNGLTYGALATTTRAGYTFGGWYTAVNGGGTLVASSTTVAISAAQTLYAKWTVNAVSTVTFDAQGGTTPVPASMTVTNGLTYGALATTTRAGYTFAGWWTAVNGGGTQVASSTTVTITAAQTLYAKWTVNAVSTVTFDAQGGTTPVPLSMTVTNGLTYGTLATTTRSGYTFGGWYTAVNGGGTEVTSGTAVTITAAQTLYAKWTVSAVSTVTFDAQGGTAPVPASTTVTNGLTYGTLATTTRAGYTFAGWWTGTGGTGTQVTSGTTVTITAAQTLYAKWTVNAISTVTFDAQGGTAASPSTTTVTNGLTYGELATTTRAGYTFAGWWTAVNGGGTQVASGTTVTITAAQTLYAKWTVNAISTVTFDAQGGTAPVPASTTVTNGLTYGTLATTARAGFTFGGWWTGTGGTGTQVTSGTTVTIASAQTLYAKWTVNAVSTVSFDAQGGTTPVPASTIVTNGLTYGTLAATARAGYTFAGWWTGAGGTGTQVTSGTTVTITAAQTLYANWTLNAGSEVTFDAQGGTAPSPASTVVTNGLTYGALATTTRAGYTFAGWWTGAGGTGTQVTSDTTVTITAAQTLYAKWTLNAVSTVAFDAQGGTTPIPASTVVTNGLTYGALATTTRAGYTFAGWWTGTGGTGTQVTSGTTVTITASQTLYAKWTVNDAPVAQAQSVTTAEDTAKEITLVATDAEGDVLTYLIVTGPAHGTLSTISSNLVTYTPAANYNGPDSFTFTARDSSLTSTPATVSITVTAVNDAPVAQAQSVTTPEDTAQVITLVATDVENTPLIYAIATPPAHGSLSLLSTNKVTYTPATNYSGPDSFTFTARDSTLTSTPATVSITVTPANDAPVAQAQSVTTSEDAAKEITLDATDTEGDALTYLIATVPAHGTLSAITSNRVTYTPSANYSGPDSFTFTARDSSLTSTPATVSITVTAVNDAPVAQVQDVTTAEDTAKEITLSSLDAEGDTLTYLIATVPAHGTLSAITSNRVTYTPSADYNGPDTFEFRATDGSLTGATAVVSITVTPVNDAPVAQPQSVTTTKDTVKVITLVATDVEGDALVYLIATVPAHGTLGAVTSNRVTYTPAANYFGPDSFTFAAKDASLTSTPVTVSISVSQVNTVPVAQAQSVTTDEDMAKAITLVANDAEGDALTYLVATGPAHGSLSALSSNQVTYTPAANYSGPDSFTFRASDAALTSTPATVSITVTAVNDLPIAQPQSVTTSEDTAKAITLVATDSDGDALTYAVVTGPSHGSLSVVSSNAITYTPAANYSGPDSFTFKAHDGSTDSTPATVSITVTSVNDAPAAQAQSVTTDEDTAVAITLSASDAEGAPLSYLIAAIPAHGTLSAVISNQVTYTPATNYNGPDSFTFRASDGSLTGAIATVSITVTPVNDAPVAQAQSVSAVKNTDKAITLVATDVDGDALTYAVVTGPLHGSLSVVSSNAITYTPEADYTGPDSFTFKANDGLVDSATGTVSITVTAGIVLPPNNTAPVPKSQSVTTAEDTDKVITLVATDAQTNALTYLIVTYPTHGTLSVIASNQVTYKPTLNYVGTDSFTFTATDTGLTGTPATVSITVTAVNDAPIAFDQTVTTPANTSVSVIMTGADAEGTALTFAVLTGPSHGTLGRVMLDRVTYTPAANYNGLDSFTMRSKDGTLTSTPATVYIRVGVANTNTAPVLSVISNRTVVVGETVSFLVQAHDADIPANTLTFALNAPLVPPVNAATLDSHTGQFTWTAAGSDEGKVFSFTVTVTDDGVPPLSDNQSFQVSVAGQPPVVGISLLNGVPRLVWNSAPPRRYQLRFKDKLTDPSWTNLGGEVTATGPTLSYDDESAQNHTNRFYRVLLIPEL
jgi:uncharacterized repeat protein (TIGR02543 family)